MGGLQEDLNILHEAFKPNKAVARDYLRLIKLWNVPTYTLLINSIRIRKYITWKVYKHA